ncbi:hypothetical protein [Vibrio sp. SCSIO 43137]|uniref:hypothetical protein n=1 Tax=Vibrio sp. SCSIO 43137 TaxID=3021011 RepID=UPI0023071592|nr:hypothetical protein [Vibrio sp. SCSIO 43137]WCE28784.1 hypothetical protein PK654_10470 [Vibrio sp. SCSIO 43137]
MMYYESELVMYRFCEGDSIEDVASFFRLPRKEVEDILIRSCLNGRLNKVYEPTELVA